MNLHIYPTTVCNLHSTIAGAFPRSFLCLHIRCSIGTGSPPAAPGSRNNSICCFISVCLCVCEPVRSCMCAWGAVSPLHQRLCLHVRGRGRALRFLGLLVWALLCSTGSIWPTTALKPPLGNLNQSCLPRSGLILLTLCFLSSHLLELQINMKKLYLIHCGFRNFSDTFTFTHYCVVF